MHKAALGFASVEGFAAAVAAFASNNVSGLNITNTQVKAAVAAITYALNSQKSLGLTT